MDTKLNLLSIDALHDHNVTVVRVQMDTPIGVFTGSGSARRFPTDKGSNEIGYNLALARAMRSITNKIERRARGLVRNADWVAEQRQAAADRPAKTQVAVVADKPAKAAKKAAKTTKAAKKNKAGLKVVRDAAPKLKPVNATTVD